MRSESVVIIDAVRSPMGRGGPGGTLSSVPAVKLLAQVLRGLLDRTDVDPGHVDDVLIGGTRRVADQADLSWRSAGLPEHGPALMVDRRCGSSQHAVHLATQGVLAGAYDVVVVGGIESTSQAGGPRAQRATPPGIYAELLAANWGLTREQLDEYAVRSHDRAAEVAAAGEFHTEIVPISVWSQDSRRVVTADETIRPGTTAEKLAGLRPAFDSPGMSDRFPEIRWRITAGNTSQYSDGASAVLIASEGRARELGLRPRARLHACVLAGDDPATMLTALVPAAREALAQTGLRPRDIDHFEVNEAFAAVPLAWQAELDVNPDLLNPRGGAIALGHPRGASGTRLLTTMLNALEATGGRYGLQAMSEANGTVNVTVVERV